MTLSVVNPGPGLRQAQTYGGVKVLNGIPTLLHNCIYNGNTDIR
jgi:hypothetical protein